MKTNKMITYSHKWIRIYGSRESYSPLIVAESIVECRAMGITF